MSAALARRRLRWLAGILILGLAFRLAVVASWRAPAGDGMQYHKLSQELIAHGRLAFGPPPAAVSHSRLPGYPLFLAHLVVREAPLGLGDHLVRATLANVILDLGTALLVFLLLRELGLCFGVALGGLAATLLCPLLVLHSCYGLTETLSTFLATLQVYLALRATRSRPLLFAVLLGVAAGYAQLTRADAVTILPAVAVAILAAQAPWRRRLAVAGLSALVAAAVFAPWPLRNLREFGAPHLGAWYWRTAGGTPLPVGPIRWARTWGTSAPGESYLDFAMSNQVPLDYSRPTILMPAMYDDPVEKARLIALFQRYNRERLSPAVAAEFDAIADARAAAHPWRTWVVLPIKRIINLWSPLPEYELPMRVAWLGLPRLRPVFGWFDKAVFGFAVFGAVALWRKGRGGRHLLAVLGAGIATRTAMFSLAVPLGVTQRYLIEVYPLLLLLAVLGATVLRSRLAQGGKTAS